MKDATETPDLVTHLRRPGFWSNGMIAATALVVAMVVGLAADVVPRLSAGKPIGDILKQFSFFGVVAAVTVLVALRRLIVLLRPVAPIEFFEDHLRLPASVDAYGAVSVPYRDILSFSLRGSPIQPQLLVESKKYIFLFSGDMFVDPDGARTVFAAIEMRLLSLPDGHQILEQMDRRRALAHVALRKRTVVTQVLLGTIAVFWANEWLTGAFNTPLGLIGWGAAVPALVRHGEWFRLIAANFLHGGAFTVWLHVGVCALSLYFLGMVVERLLGSTRFLLVYLVSCLAAMTASVVADRAILSVGSSGAIFGLLGALAVFNLRFRTQLPLGFRQPLRWWIFILVLNGGLSLLVPNVDLWAHVAGFATGIVCTALLCARWTQVQPTPPVGLPIHFLTGAITAVFVAGLALAVRNKAHFDTAAELSAYRTVLDDPRINPITLNDVAWTWAIDAKVSSDSLEMAAQAAKRAVAAQPAHPEFLDTLATVEYRRGHIEEAVRIEREVLEQEANPIYASQLLRFLLARTKSAGPLFGKGLSSTNLGLRFSPVTAADKTDATLTLDLETALDEPVAILAAVRDHDERVGFVQIVVGPGPARALTWGNADEPEMNTWSRETRIQLLSVDLDHAPANPAGPGNPTAPASPAATADHHLQFWPMDHTINALP